MDNYLDVLMSEFNGEDNSFATQLRIDLKWDEDAFLRLTRAMRAYCENHSEKEPVLERWLASGFWFVPHFVRSWTSHPNFRARNPAVDYDKAYTLLDDLAFWFFIGQES